MSHSFIFPADNLFLKFYGCIVIAKRKTRTAFPVVAGIKYSKLLVLLRGHSNTAWETPNVHELRSRNILTTDTATANGKGGIRSKGLGIALQ